MRPAGARRGTRRALCGQLRGACARVPARTFADAAPPRTSGAQSDPNNNDMKAMWGTCIGGHTHWRVAALWAVA
eukprot:6059478-Prymnesium_polylepis.1